MRALFVLCLWCSSVFIVVKSEQFCANGTADCSHENGQTNVTATTVIPPDTRPESISTADISSSRSTTTGSSNNVTPGSINSTTPGPTTSGVGRAMNFNDGSDGIGNSTVTPEKGSLQDLSLDDIDEISVLASTDKTAVSTTEGGSVLISAETWANATAKPNGSCEENGVYYSKGQHFFKGCDAACTCEESGSIRCVPRCEGPFFRRGMERKDPTCIEKLVDDPCCAILVCSHDTETEPLEECTYKNNTYKRGDTIQDNCDEVCTCGVAGKLSCKPRCPKIANNTSDHCVVVPDPADSCCKIILCDVTLTDHDSTKTDAGISNLRLLETEVVNSTSIRLGLAGDPPENLTVESSTDQNTWRLHEVQNLVVTGFEPGNTYYVRAVSGGVVSNTLEVIIPAEKKKDSGGTGGFCEYKGRTYKLMEEFYDGCEAFCTCTEIGTHCATIECPTDFALDVLDPTCISWEHPPDFVPLPPRCCPDRVICKDNGSCIYAGERFDNWAEIPRSITGCEQQCFCEFGNVTCQNMCTPVPAAPPSDLQCPGSQPFLGHMPDDDCCLHWMCQKPKGFPDVPVPPGFIPHPAQQPDTVTVLTLEAVDEHTVRLVFAVPPVLVGLHGRVELRYTSDARNNDVRTWQQQILAPPDDLIATPQLEFELAGLEPDTLYKIQITVMMRDIHNSPSSQILTVKTPPAYPQTTYPPAISVDPKLAVTEVNSTWIHLVWRKFSDFELQFIDGVQIRYKEIDDKIYSATPLIHRSVTDYTIEDLKPETKYEVGIFFIPFPGQTTELQAQNAIQVTTSEEQDAYRFDIKLEVHNVKSTTVEITWNGVPYPEDKFVNIFRVIYQSESGKEDFNTFKIAKHDSQAKTLIKDLKSGMRYRLWLEVYLTNGKIKKSNVQDFVTKPGPASGVAQKGKLERSPQPVTEPGDYYGPLVGVAIIAALAIVAALILLLILVRKYGQNKAAISASRKSQSAYDNPSYKTSDDTPMATNGTSASRNSHDNTERA